MWKAYGETLLGKYSKLNNVVDNPSVHYEKDIQDVLNAFSVIDRNNAWKDNVRFCATKADRIPRYHTEEANMGLLLDRIMAVELQLSCKM